MAKLYAELSSDKGGRKASKGGDNEVTLKLYNGNSFIIKTHYDRESHTLLIIDDTENLIIEIDGNAQVEHNTA